MIYEIYCIGVFNSYYLDFISGDVMKLYGKTLMLRRGKMLQISLLYECNLKCDYCSLEMPTGIRPKAKRVSLDDWKQFILDFTNEQKIREVYVSGGEPSMVKWMPELVNWLVQKGFPVTVFSNLFDADRLLQIKKHYRVKIDATYHHEWDKLDRFHNAYLKIKDHIRVDVGEIGYQVLPYSKVKPFIDMDGLKDKEFRVSPDLEVFDSCYDHFKEKSK